MKAMFEKENRVFLIFSIASILFYVSRMMTNQLATGQGYLSCLVLTILIGIVGFYTDSRFDKWYVIQVLMGAFLLFMEKNFLAIALVGLSFVLLVVLAPVTYQSLEKLVYLAVGYVMLFLNMSVILKGFRVPTEVELYSVKMSALLWPLFILAMVVLYVLGEFYIKRQNDEAQCITQFKVLLKKGLICIAIGAVLVVSQLLTGTIVEPTNIITKVLYYIQTAFHSNVGVYTFMTQGGGILGLLILVGSLFITADVLLTKKTITKVDLEWQYKLIGIVFLIQSVCLPQSVPVIILYMVWMLIGIWRRRNVA